MALGRGLGRRWWMIALVLLFGVQATGQSGDSGAGPRPDRGAPIAGETAPDPRPSAAPDPGIRPELGELPPIVVQPAPVPPRTVRSRPVEPGYPVEPEAASPVEPSPVEPAAVTPYVAQPTPGLPRYDRVPDGMVPDDLARPDVDAAQDPDRIQALEARVEALQRELRELAGDEQVGDGVDEQVGDGVGETAPPRAAEEGEEVSADGYPRPGSGEGATPAEELDTATAAGAEDEEQGASADEAAAEDTYAEDEAATGDAGGSDDEGYAEQAAPASAYGLVPLGGGCRSASDCDAGEECLDAPYDSCNPALGWGNCPGVCGAAPPALQSCGGATGRACPTEGSNCYDDPRDACRPQLGWRNCPALCTP